MHSFLVLGQIPGTSIQITFEMWALLMAAIIAIGMLVIVHRRQTGIDFSQTFLPTISQD